jgi:hypothetical protein
MYFASAIASLRAEVKLEEVARRMSMTDAESLDSNGDGGAFIVPTLQTKAGTFSSNGVVVNKSSMRISSADAALMGAVLGVSGLTLAMSALLVGLPFTFSHNAFTDFRLCELLSSESVKLQLPRVYGGNVPPFASIVK